MSIVEQDVTHIKELIDFEEWIATSEPPKGNQAHDAASQGQVKETILPPKLGDEDAPGTTLAGFLAAYRESPEALTERLLNPNTNLLAFSNILFAPQMTALLELLERMNANNDDSQEQAI